MPLTFDNFAAPRPQKSAVQTPAERLAFAKAQNTASKTPEQNRAIAASQRWMKHVSGVSGLLGQGRTPGTWKQRYEQRAGKPAPTFNDFLNDPTRH